MPKIDYTLVRNACLLLEGPKCCVLEGSPRDRGAIWTLEGSPSYRGGTGPAIIIIV